ncbi:MAG: dTDP-4-dehydrorhamnose 3,5-epimerase [Cyclobacteriaceae bacterium]|nr:dTDP-4-dehydrorhamnose 3,5-epimerase [Cyclobacteriaceae bacterium]
MKVSETGFNGLLILMPKVIGDNRGYFMESYNQKTLLEAGIDIKFVQDNQSSSSRGVLRGLHFQNAPHAQTKLVRVLTGTILDVVVDLRKSESTFGKSYAIELSDKNKKQLLVPKGFAHGFVVLSDRAEVFYKCDEYYNAQAEGGIFYSDPSMGIDWLLEPKDLILSGRDQSHPFLSEAKFNF